jgi:hypothetical protein
MYTKCQIFFKFAFRYLWINENREWDRILMNKFEDFVKRLVTSHEVWIDKRIYETFMNQNYN